MNTELENVVGIAATAIRNLYQPPNCSYSTLRDLALIILEANPKLTEKREFDRESLPPAVVLKAIEYYIEQIDILKQAIK